MIRDPLSRKRTPRFFKKTPTIQFLKRVESRPHRLKRFVRVSVLGPLVIRYGALHGTPDLRPIKCRYRGINHGDLVQPGTWCICRTLSLRPSPLHNDISKIMEKVP
ncbi:Spr6p [Lachancea thermotolerans CBS 6340]|uniref:KLTH0C06116p n=1 Tax=Lachancea thermotolerans (strain ATCC 56472 / CBS 6340 / NRRL Y-8284) TaxID=559295 RepID=C5DE42_LACTC|nr:KLTH0C06116p [Lachancea thermotolerans CBS 6340]CAR22053.1 KLTH0C06116p [Lachancea thermotolerans CBS 6340]